MSGGHVVPDTPEPTGAPDPDRAAVRSVVFHDDYELSILLEADGRLRAVLHAVGVDGIELFTRGSATVVSNARHGDGGAQRADEWAERLDLLQTTMQPVHYRTTPPGAESGQPATVECIATPIPNADGTLDSILLQAYDRTTAERAQAAARGYQEQLRVALSVTAMASFALQLDVPRITGDDRLPEILGTDVAAAVLADGVEGLLSMAVAEDVEQVRRAFAVATAGGPDLDVEYRLPGNPKTEGDVRWIGIRGRVEFDEATGEPVRMLGVVEDLTDRRAEEEARLRWQKRDAIGSLAGGVAHDFNNVITAILSNASLAQQELRIGASPETSLAEIARGAERASGIVQRLLAFSREDDAGTAPESTPFDLGGVVAEACGLVASSLPSGTEIRRSIAPDLPPVLGSAGELHRVIVNLLSNAGDAVERGGIVEISVDVTAAPTPAIAGWPAGAGAVRVRVQDDGPGIPASQLSRIFDPFFTTKPSGKGTGLGLAAAQTIVRNHGGTIDAANAPGGGARFTVCLPAHVVKPSADETAANAVAEAAEADRPRIVFVDDERPLARLAERALPAYGFAVEIHTDPRDALAAIQADPSAVDALVTDLSMPRMSGLELVEQVHRVRPDLPVVLSSGFLTAANRQDAERLGVGAILPKPCSIDALALELSVLVGAAKPRSA
ncbi:MAG: ATP-binding protein [Solirubrobacteraceae bacterium]|nr:ATP-binding protein [Patulibacter sp.]